MEIYKRKFPLTPRQKEVFNVIKKYIDEHDQSPLDKDIQSALGIKSPGNVTQFKRALKDRGWIDYKPMLARSIVIL